MTGKLLLQFWVVAVLVSCARCQYQTGQATYYNSIDHGCAQQARIEPVLRRCRIGVAACQTSATHRRSANLVLRSTLVYCSCRLQLIKPCWLLTVDFLVLLCSHRYCGFGTNIPSNGFVAAWPVSSSSLYTCFLFRINTLSLSLPVAPCYITEWQGLQVGAAEAAAPAVACLDAYMPPSYSLHPIMLEDSAHHSCCMLFPACSSLRLGQTGRVTPSLVSTVRAAGPASRCHASPSMWSQLTGQSTLTAGV
jgi:hypothetical protein